MIKKLKQDKGNLSVLLEVTNLTNDEHIGLSRILNGVTHTESACGQYLMVVCGEGLWKYDELLELVDIACKRYIGTVVTVDKVVEHRYPDGRLASTQTKFSEVEVPLCEEAQDYFYDRPTAKFGANVWKEPTHGGTSFFMDSVDDYGWCSRTEEKLESSKVKEIMVGYIEQLPECGASEENWKEYFCGKLGFDFDSLC